MIMINMVLTRPTRPENKIQQDQPIGLRTRTSTLKIDEYRRKFFCNSKIIHQLYAKKGKSVYQSIYSWSMAVNKANIMVGAKYEIVKEAVEPAPSKAVEEALAAEPEFEPEAEGSESVLEAEPEPEPESEPELELEPVESALEPESVVEASVAVLEEPLLLLVEESLLELDEEDLSSSSSDLVELDALMLS